MTIHKITYSRNGSGIQNGFYRVFFTDGRGGNKQTLMAIVFPDKRNFAVINLNNYDENFHPDYFYPTIRKAIIELEIKESATGESDFFVD